MFDQVLGKSAFIDTLTKNEVPKEKIDEQWKIIEKLFVTAFIRNLFNQLSDSELRSITENLNPDNPSGVQKAIQNLGQYLKDNPGKIPKDLVEKCVKETYNQYEASLK